MTSLRWPSGSGPGWRTPSSAGTATASSRDAWIVAQELDVWRPELLEAFTPTGKRRVSNGPAEAVNALIKKVKNVGHGFRNLDNHRLRLLLLLAAGVDWRTVTWQVSPPTPIRGRSPRLVA